jgi:hypothetical protein
LCGKDPIGRMSMALQGGSRLFHVSDGPRNIDKRR